MPRRHVTSALACLLAAAALAAGCGGGSDSSDLDRGNASRASPRRRRANSPRPKARPCGEIVKAADSHAELVVSPAALAFYKGENRYPFGVFQPDRSQVDDAEVALYIAKVPHVRGKRRRAGENGKQKKGAVAQAREEALEQPAMGPYPAAIESLATKPAFRAQTTSQRPRRGDGRLHDRTRLPQRRRVAGRGADQAGRTKLAATLLPSATVGEFKGVPQVGEKAPLIHTPTPADVGGDLSKITTRIPPDTQNRVDYADALGKEPILLLFATPQFCQSRVCGPVVDVAEQVKEQYGDKAAFIHMEIYNDNDPSKGVQAPGAGVPPAERAVAVRDRPPGRHPRGDRGGLRSRPA